ncbi:MAG TPA: hypothetical protein VFZ65_20570 [Planctomycetota bacterium]|nr:hypothetical protein [Planctomycetota bacterium]
MRPTMLTVLLCLPLAAQTPATPAPAATPAVPEVGKSAPAFRLNDETGAATSVGGPSKTWTVLAFYPKASTGG